MWFIRRRILAFAAIIVKECFYRIQTFIWNRQIAPILLRFGFRRKMITCCPWIFVERDKLGISFPVLTINDETISQKLFVGEVDFTIILKFVQLIEKFI